MVDKARPDAVGGTKHSTPAAADTRSRAKRALVYTGLGLGALGAAYGTGRLQTQGAVSEAREQTVERAAAEAEQGKLRAEAAGKVRELEGRRRLSLALVTLDERNFGTAQRHLTKAGALLAESKGDAALEELARTVSAYKLVAADDIGTQRKQLMDFTQRFDTLRPPPE
jgi:hypothetical protein